MKIIYVCNAPIPSKKAYSVHVMKMCNALSAIGNSVTLFTPNSDTRLELGSKNIYEYYGVNENFHIERLSWPKGIKGKSILYALDIGRRLSKCEPDIVLTRFVYSAPISAMLGYRTIFESHRPVWNLGTVANVAFDLFCVQRCAKALVVISKKLKKIYLQQKSMSPQFINVVHDASDDFSYSKKSLISGNNDKFKVGYVGSLYDGKGIKTVCEVSREMKDIEFHVVGGRKRNLDKWEKYAKNDNINFHGYISPAKVPNYINDFDVCLLPNKPDVYIGDGEDTNIGSFTSPLKMFEYMSAGKPIVASDLDILNEVLEDEYNAIMCSHSSVTEWASSIRRIKNDKQLRNRIASNARCDFVEKYSWRSRAKQVLDVLG